MFVQPTCAAAYQPPYCRRFFKPESSGSFRLVSKDVFDLEYAPCALPPPLSVSHTSELRYADSTVLKGYQASDVVALGE